MSDRNNEDNDNDDDYEDEDSSTDSSKQDARSRSNNRRAAAAAAGIPPASRDSSPVPPRIKDPVDPSMVLSEIEHLWAVEVKRAVLEDDDLLPLTDMEYAQHALVAEGNLQQALLRIERMQDFHQVYDIQQTVEQGLQCLLGLMEQQPGFVLHIDVDPVHHASVNVIDLGVFDPHVALAIDPNTGRENWRTYISGIYYMKYSAQPSFANIRSGFYALADCGDVDNTNFKPEAQQRMFDEVLRSYPFKWRSFMAFNTGYVANIMVSLMKTVMLDPMKQIIQVGCQLEENEETRNPTQRLRDFYLQPNIEEAYRHILVKAHALLEQRVHNQATFRL